VAKGFVELGGGGGPTRASNVGGSGGSGGSGEAWEVRVRGGEGWRRGGSTTVLELAGCDHVATMTDPGHLVVVLAHLLDLMDLDLALRSSSAPTLSSAAADAPAAPSPARAEIASFTETESPSRDQAAAAAAPAARARTTPMKVGKRTVLSPPVSGDSARTMPASPSAPIFGAAEKGAMDAQRAGPITISRFVGYDWALKSRPLGSFVYVLKRACGAARNLVLGASRFLKDARSHFAGVPSKTPL
jgi:hypothetical protein